MNGKSKLTVLAIAGALAVTGCASAGVADDLGGGPSTRPAGETSSPATPGCPRSNDGRAIVDYIDFLQFGGRSYNAGMSSPAGTVAKPALGAQVGTVRCELSRIQPAPGYLPRDGDAGFLKPGTALYEIRGYPSSFRLAAVRDGAYRIYEVDTAPQARTGGDLLPLTGLVRKIEVLDGDTATRVLGQVTDPSAITSLIAELVKAPVDQDRRITSDPLFLRFSLADGTTVQRAWFPKDSLVERGIAVPRSFTQALQRTIASR